MPVTFQQTDNLGEIVIDNPPLNILDADMFVELANAVAQAAASNFRALLIRAEGDDFSVGPDPSVFFGLDETTAKGFASQILGFFQSVEAIPVPTVALIQGQCYTGALELCLACDIIWAAEGAQIGQVEALAGGMPYGGGTQRIASRVGAARAAEMVMTAPILSAETLAAWGLVNRVLPKGDLAREGRALAQSLADGPTLAHTRTKRLIRAWRSGGVEAADALLPELGPAVMLSEDLQNGVRSLQRDGFGHATFHNR
jgi:enoyl-CoA hydratase/carnithine racemase